MVVTFAPAGALRLAHGAVYATNFTKNTGVDKQKRPPTSALILLALSSKSARWLGTSAAKTLAQ